MAVHDTEVNCCGASKWTTVIAGFQMVTAIFWIVVVSMAWQDQGPVHKSSEFSYKEKESVDIRSIITGFLIAANIGLAIGIFIQQEKRSLLVVWVVSAVVGTIVDGCLVITVGVDEPVTSLVICGVIRICAICIFLQRNKDISAVKMISGHAVHFSPKM